MSFTFTYPPALAAASTADNDFIFHTSLIPISPTAPHRSAPCPPKQAAKKSGRHIPMKEPSQCGLFTVSEIPEVDFTPAPSAMVDGDACFDSDMSYDVDESMTDADLTLLHTPRLSPEPTLAARRFSWSSDGSDERQIVTPHLGYEADDPFASWSTIPLQDNEGKAEQDYDMAEVEVHGQPSFTPFAKGLLRARRAPPPLTLTTRFSLPPASTPTSAATPALSGHPASATNTIPDPELLTPLSSISTTSSGSLMPALPIVSPEEWSSQRSCQSALQTPTTPTFASLGRAPRKCQSPTGTVDLASALEELLTSCGEIDTSSQFESHSLRRPSPRPISTETTTPDEKLKRTTAPYAPRKPSRAHPHSQLPSTISTKSTRGQVCGGELSSSPLESDHSFLACLSRSETSEGGRSLKSARSGRSARSAGSVGSLGSAGSTGSGRLPGRKSLPMEWRFGQMI
ncbi:hypothetical protein IAR50_005601 [Cryptococcus sp. DSM 104548]